MSEMWVNMGPQHPMTHGLWNLRVKIDGEIILDVDPDMGYLHRGIEKISEDRHYNEVVTLMDRCCYVAGLAWEHLYVVGCEQALHLEPPERAQWIRTMADELQRIASHVMWYAAFVQDIGLMSPFLYGMRDRDLLLDLFQSFTGARMTYRVQPGRRGPQRPPRGVHGPMPEGNGLADGPVQGVRRSLSRLGDLPGSMRRPGCPEGERLHPSGGHRPDAPVGGDPKGPSQGPTVRRL